MVKKLLNLMVIIVALAALAGIVYVIFFYDFTGGNIFTGEKKEAPVEKKTEKPAEEITAQPATEGKKLETGKREISASEINLENLKRVAASFAERFGSYSNHSNYSNISDLKIFMTDAMQAWADGFIEEIKAKQGSSDIYYGVTTKTVSTEVKNFDEDTGQAEILVKTQRRESTGTMDNASIIYQDILISFVRERDSWKVDKAEWQEK